MENWTGTIGDLLEWGDGSFDVVYVNEVTGDMEWKPATAKQIEAHKRHQEWIAAGCPDVTLSLSNFI